MVQHCLPVEFWGGVSSQYSTVFFLMYSLIRWMNILTAHFKLTLSIPNEIPKKKTTLVKKHFVLNDGRENTSERQREK